MTHHLIIGADGMIGKALRTALPDAYVTTRADLDLAVLPSTWPVLPKADVAYICAAVTKLDACENDPTASRQVNVVGTGALIEKLQVQGTHVVFLSSNQVFDGSVPFRKAHDVQCPINEYGRQKAEVEQWLAARPHPYTILRLTKVLAAPLPILAQWEADLRAGKSIEAFDDLLLAPVPIQQVVNRLIEIGNAKPTGIMQLSGEHEASYYDVACEMAVSMKLDVQKIIPISAQSKGIPRNFLPQHVTLATT